MPITVLSEETVNLTLEASKPDAHATSELILKGSGYTSEREARRAGQITRSGLRATGVDCHVPMDLGPDRPPGFFFRGARETLERQLGVQIQADVHGLQTYEESGRPIHFGPAPASIIQSWPLAKFVATLNDRLRDPPVLSDDLTLAIDLYSSAMFELSLRARFITLVTALEVLSVRRLRSPETLQHVDMLVALTRSAANQARSSGERKDPPIAWRVTSRSAAAVHCDGDSGSGGRLRVLRPDIRRRVTPGIRWSLLRDSVDARA